MNQSLVDDFLVLSDKIGSANFFWSFPSKAYQDQVVRRDTMRSTLVQLANHTESLNRQIQEEISTRCDLGRDTWMKELSDLRNEEALLDKQLDRLKVNDPEEILRVEKLAMSNKAAADRWTDNIWQIKSYMTKRKGMSGKEVYIALGLVCLYVYGNSSFMV